MSLIDLEVDSQVALITLKDVKNGNRLNFDLLVLLERTVKESLTDPSVRVIVLRSAADAFCMGMDLSQVGSKDNDATREALEPYGEVLFSLYTSPKPVVCLLDGAVKAGGVGIVCACDIVLSSAQTTFELGEVLFGLIPANVLPYLLSQRLNPQKARYIVLTAKNFCAEEAYRLGLVDELFAEEEFEKGARGVIKGLLRSSPWALAEVKSFTQLLLGKDLKEARAMATEKFIKMVNRPDVLRGIEAFKAGELPDWFSRYRPQKPLTRKE